MPMLVENDILEWIADVRLATARRYEVQQIEQLCHQLRSELCALFDETVGITEITYDRARRLLKEGGLLDRAFDKADDLSAKSRPD